jgi:hypothetical protein
VCEGHVQYEYAGINLPIHVRSIQLLMKPSIDTTNGTHCLAFNLEIEDADLAYVPALIDKAITNAVRSALKPDQTRLLWDFGKTLSHAFRLPPALEPLDVFEVSVDRGSVAITADALVFSVAVRNHVRRSGRLQAA